MKLYFYFWLIIVVYFFIIYQVFLNISQQSGKIFYVGYKLAKMDRRIENQLDFPIKKQRK